MRTWSAPTLLPYLVIFFGALVAAAGALWAARQQSIESRHLLGRVTGGDSFVYLEPLRLPGQVKYLIRQEGDHPTFDVVVRIQEIVRVEGKRKRRLVYGPADAGRMLKRGSGLDWTYPDASPQEPQTWPLVFSEPPLLPATVREFRIELAARNGIIVQRLRMEPAGDRWRTDSKTIRRAGRGPLALPSDFLEAQDKTIHYPGDEDDLEDT